MFKQNFIQAFRIIRKHKVHSFLNILGLSIGICCTVLVLLFIQNERSYDKHHKNHDRI